jgi:hypothetical protein
MIAPEPAICASSARAHMCRYGALGGARLATFCARVRCAKAERRSAFLKEWGRVKVLVLVAALGVVNAGAGGS